MHDVVLSFRLIDYVYMHINITLLFQIWQYREFDTGKVSFILNWAFSH